MGGDTNAYFHDIHRLMVAGMEDPVTVFKMISGLGDISPGLEYEILRGSFFRMDSKEIIVVRFGTIASYFGFGTYFGTTVFFSFFSFLGLWKLYLIFRRNYPALDKKLAFATLFVPSVVFWGSGILKDSITIGMLGFLLYGIEQLFKRKQRSLGAVVSVAFSGFVIFLAKPYILVAIAPAIVIWVVYGYKDRIKSTILRAAFVPILLLFVIASTYGILDLTSRYIPKYALENLLGSAQSMQGWHYVEGANEKSQHGRGSSYSLGSYESNLNGVLSKFFPAVNVTLFRPYPWEARNPAMLAAAIESMIILLVSIYLLFGIGVFKFFKKINADSFLLMCLIYTLIFAFAVGFSSYNFGALVRYKVPCIPFFIAALFILNAKRVETSVKSKFRRSVPER